MKIGNFLLKLTDKWPAKVISLAAALLISVFYRLSTLETRVINIPLKAEIPANLILVDTIDHTIRVTLRGETNNVLTITEDDIEAYIDLSRYNKEGTYMVPIQVRKIGNALGADPLELTVSPAEIQITLEEKLFRDIPVYPVISGSIPYGYAITSQSIKPESILVSGPRSSLDTIKEFNTEPIDIDGRNRDFTILIQVINDDEDIVVYGNRLIEFSCTIERIERVRAQQIFFPPAVLPDEPLPENGEIE